MTMSVLLEMVKWNIYRKWHTAPLMIPPLMFAVFLPDMAALTMVPFSFMSGVFVMSGGEFIYPVAPRAVAAARLLTAGLLRIVPLWLTATLVSWRVDSTISRVGSPFHFALLGTGLALIPELWWFYRPRFSLFDSVSVNFAMPLLLPLLLFLPALISDSALNAMAISTPLFALLGTAHMLYAPERLVRAPSPIGGIAENSALGREPTSVSGNREEVRVGSGLGWRDAMRMSYGQSGTKGVLTLLPVLLIIWQPTSSMLMMLGIMNTMFALPATTTGWMSIYPISRRFQLTMLAAPAFAITLALGLAQMMPIRFSQRLSSGAPSGNIEGDYSFNSPTRLPITYWDAVPSRAPARAKWVTRAPWGESVEMAIVAVGPMRLMNSYTTRRYNSKRFIEWQVSRMTNTVYGRELTVEQLRESNLPRRRTQSWSMLVMQGAVFGCWCLLMVLTGLDNRQWPKFVTFVPIVAMFWELRRGDDSGAVVIPLIQRWLLFLDLRLPTPMLAIPLAAAPVGLMLWAIHQSLARREVGNLLMQAQLKQARMAQLSP